MVAGPTPRHTHTDPLQTPGVRLAEKLSAWNFAESVVTPSETVTWVGE